MINNSLIEIDHVLEKLQFALAISQTIGDKVKSDKIKKHIKKYWFKILGAWQLV